MVPGRELGRLSGSLESDDAGDYGGGGGDGGAPKNCCL